METDGHPAAVADEGGADGGDRARATAPARCGAARDEAEALAAGVGARGTRFRRWRAGGRRRFSRTSPCRAASWRRWCGSSPTRRAKFDLQIGTFGHMGDGNLHPTFLTDERDSDEMHRVHEALDAIVKQTLELGGTITGEHGVGLAKKAVAAAADGRRQLRADAADQADARSARPAQPRQDFRLAGDDARVSRLNARDTGLTATLKTLDYSVLQQCMHCGMCLPTCPTYDATKLRAQQPARTHRADARDRRRRARGRRGRSPTK